MPDKTKFFKGQLLHDSGQLSGSFFQHTVVLICQHDAEGAFDLVLNRATGSKVGEMIVADLPDVIKESPLYLGGPVQPTALSFLHTDSFIPDANVLPNLNLDHSLDALMDIGESFSLEKKIRISRVTLAGAAGSSKSEMKRKAWLAHPASFELDFETLPEQLWQAVLRRKGGRTGLHSPAQGES